MRHASRVYYTIRRYIVLILKVVRIYPIFIHVYTGITSYRFQIFVIGDLPPPLLCSLSEEKNKTITESNLSLTQS